MEPPITMTSDPDNLQSRPPSPSRSPSRSPPHPIPYGLKLGENIYSPLIDDDICCYCGSPDSQKPCHNCRLVQYCSKKCWVYDRRPRHRQQCKRIVYESWRYNYYRKKLTRQFGDDVFEKKLGDWRFWGNEEDGFQKLFVDAVMGLVEAGVKFNTRRAIREAVGSMRMMSLLNPRAPSPLMGSLHLRIGEDQSCYDHCKLWFATGANPDYDWDTHSDNLQIQHADVLEPVEPFFKAGGMDSLYYLVPTTLFKIRLLHDLQALQRLQLLAGTILPRELYDIIAQDSVRYIAARNKAIRDQDPSHLIPKVTKQIRFLFNEADKACPPQISFWRVFLKAEKDWLWICEFGDEDVRRVRKVVADVYNSWVETPGAIGVVEELVASRAVDEGIVN
ncbi:hypothetical protein B0J11DRAFT_493260 [Dendryphion nanum]|uniref:MYND-type domain-containing protein n=1 Tax=Dendryphion nanum TaxID=256645 RepID=A0A9P9DEC7_9PLEO|nr:hypothetical protein B0J11DRAFT_493260 [Dendryphion nanum]